MTLEDLPENLVDLMVGPRPPVNFVSDGLSGVPDRVKGWDLRPSGHWHDFAYHQGGKRLDRFRADWNFRNNLWALITSQGGSLFSAYRLSTLYWLGVRLLGGRYFNWSKK